MPFISLKFRLTAFFAVLIQVQKSYYLVSLVDNDYIHGDLFGAFKEI
jgi:hypothetical protein